MKDPRPVAWLGFPAFRERPEYDVVYDNTTKLPGYRYTPIWAEKDHPSALRSQAKKKRRASTRKSPL